MDHIQPLLDWAKANETLLWWLFAGSMAVFLLTPIAVIWTLIRLPSDYFTKEHRRPLGSWDDYPFARALLLVAKNLLGVVLLLAGLAMLVAPGQGLLTVAVGLILIDFPGKYRMERWLVARRSIWRTINWLRRKAGAQPLKRPNRD